MIFKRRSWGWWLVLWQWPLRSQYPNYKLKLLYFKTGGALSMQRHKQRAEKWLVCYGHGVMVDAEHEPIGFMIPFWQWHKFTADKPTLILEKQWGSNCTEDDIERF